ncbi:MAG: diguanylate cyclase [Clostridiales bacterium]|nr:diguanylate cyclase [Clostridiales bacterium]
MNSIIARVATALLIDYTSVYYIDVNTGYYECYSTNSGYKQLELQTSGQDFYADCQRDIRAVVYEPDWDRVSAALTKESLLKQFSEKEAISIEYRLMIDGAPKYHAMRILYDTSEASDSIILGVQNVDHIVRKEQVTQTYNAIAKTLANRYATIYYIELNTDSYVEYSSSNDYKELDVPPEGADFFTETGKNVVRVIHPEDKERVLRIADKSFMMSVTEGGNKFRMEYRLIMSDGAHHVRLMAVRTGDGNHLIVALENIDEEVKSREELKTISENSKIFLQIAESLAAQYGMIYYIDADTDEYIEFTASDEYKDFNIKPVGNDFFGTSQRNVSMIIHAEDREKVFAALDKKNMLAALQEKETFSLTYRLLLSDGSSYTRMSVFWANDHKHLIMAIMSIDSEIQKENALKKTLAENATFFQIATSLANQYDTIYYVDMLNDHYIEFSSTDVYKSLEVRPSGDNFFEESLVNIDRVIHPDDREEFHRILNKTGMISILQEKHMITHTYRLLIGDGIMYARLSIIWATDNKHLIIGVMNIDQEVRKEQEIQKKLSVANEKAYRDEMTGVKNKAAFTEYEESLQEQMDMDEPVQFAVVVCDVNGLKAINDKLGHIEGDKYIKKASTLICNIWTHSPVFRIGGDEFAVILQGTDYDNRDALIEQIKQTVLHNKKNGEVIVAVGMTDYMPGVDMTINEVFERADNLMYENKTALKKE